MDEKTIEFLVAIKADPGMQASLAAIAETVKKASQKAREDVSLISSMAPKDQSSGVSDPRLKAALEQDYAIKKASHDRDVQLAEEMGKKREDLAQRFLQISKSLAEADAGSEQYNELEAALVAVHEEMQEVAAFDEAMHKRRMQFVAEELRQAKAAAREKERQAEADQDAAEKEIKSRERIRSQVERILAKEESDEKKASAAIARQRDKDFRTITTSYLTGLRDQERARQEEQRSVQRSQELFRMHSNRLGESLSQSTESVMRMARGFTMLGLVGEKDLQKVQDGLLKIQAAFDIFTGAVRGIQAVERAIESVNTITRIAAQSQEAYNVAMRAGLAIEAAGSLIGGGGGGGGGGSNRGTRRYARNRGGRAYGIRGIASDIGEEAMETVLGATAGQGVAQVGNLATSGSRLGRFIGTGTNLVRGGLTAAGLSGAGTLTGAGALGAGAVVGGSAAAAVGLGVTLGDTIVEAIRNGIAGGAAEGTITNTLGTLIPAFSDSIIKMQDAMAKSGVLLTGTTGKTLSGESARGEGLDKALIKQRAQYERILELRKQEEDVEENIKRVLADKWSMQGQLNDSIRSQLSDERQLASIIDEINQLSTDALKDNENAQSRKNDLIRQEMRLRQSIAGEHVQSLQDQLRMEQQSLATVEQRISAEKESVMTAKERFGMMSEEQQAEIIDLRERLRAGEDLDAEELGRLRGLSQGIDAEVQMQALAKAEQGGFAALGIEEESRQRVQRDEDLATFLRESIEGNKGYIAQISLDAESVAKRLLQEVNLASEKKIKEIADKFNELSTAQAGVRAKIENIVSNNIRLANESPP